MKKIIVGIAILFTTHNTNAQLKVTTKSFDLESVKKNKGWNLFQDLLTKVEIPLLN
jgi:hypothetical protein